MTRRDPLDALVRDLDFAVTPSALETVSLPEMPGLPGDEAELRSIMVAGLTDLIAESVAGQDEVRLRETLSAVGSIVPVSRFTLFERADRAERQALATRVRDREIATSDGWLVPQLERDIADYRARIAALREHLGAS